MDASQNLEPYNSSDFLLNIIIYCCVNGNLKRPTVKSNNIQRIKWVNIPYHGICFILLNLVNCILFIKHVLTGHIRCWASLNDILTMSHERNEFNRMRNLFQLVVSNIFDLFFSWRSVISLQNNQHPVLDLMYAACISTRVRYSC